MWKQEITARIVQILFREKHKKSEKKTKFFYLISKWSLLCTKIENIFIYHFTWLHNYWGMVILLSIFAFIWHPGIGFRPNPPKNTIAMEKNVPHFPLSFQIKKNSLKIFRKNQQLAEYPIQTNLPPEQKHLTIRRIEKHKKNWIACLTTPDEGICVFLGSSISDKQEYFIITDEDHWEIIYPYLRVGMVLGVE